MLDWKDKKKLTRGVGSRKERACVRPYGNWAIKFDCRVFSSQGKVNYACLLHATMKLTFKEKDHGVEKIYHLDSDTLETDCPGLIYICRPKLKYMRFIASMFSLFFLLCI